MNETTALLAGAAEVDITPQMGIQIAGDLGRLRPVEEIRERIYARALVLQSGDCQFCIVSAEICWFTDEWAAEIRRRASEKTGIPPEAILLHPQQNHSAPGIGHTLVADSYPGIPPELWWLRGGDDRYNEPAAEAIVDAIVLASRRLQPVTLKVGREIDGRTAFNRRFIMRDGTGRSHPRAEERKEILQSEGPIDPEVGVLLLTREDGLNTAALLHYTCHPVHGYPKRYISGDWPGIWANSMRGALGAECVPLVINGCCGNIHHNDHQNPQAVNNPILMGAHLTESATAALGDMHPQRSTPLAWRSVIVRIPFREFPEKEIADARAYLSEHPEPVWTSEDRTSVHWDWVYAHSLVDIEHKWRHEPYYDYEIQAVRLGDFALLALVGEPFVEAQLQIKGHSPFPYTFPAHMSNGYVGYIPTPAALERGGFETKTSNWSKLSIDAHDVIIEKSLELLAELDRNDD